MADVHAAVKPLLNYYHAPRVRDSSIEIDIEISMNVEPVSYRVVPRISRSGRCQAPAHYYHAPKVRDTATEVNFCFLNEP